MKTEEMRGLLALMVHYSSSKEPTHRERKIASAINGWLEDMPEPTTDEQRELREQMDALAALFIGRCQVMDERREKAEKERRDDEVTRLFAIAMVHDPNVVDDVPPRLRRQVRKARRQYEKEMS